MTDLPQRTHTADGTAYVELGAGEPVVLVHGVGLRLEAWAPQISHLAKRWRVLALDMPGHGESAPIARDAPLTAFVDWLANTLTQLVDEPVNIVGHSMGALLALGLASAYPQRVKRLCLLNAVYRRTPQASARVLERAKRVDAGDLDVEGPLARWFEGDLDARQSAIRDQCRHWLSGVDPAGYASAYRAFATGDAVYADHLSRLSCPALMLTGELDPNSTPQMSNAMALAAKNARAVVLPEERHMCALVSPEKVNVELDRWLAMAVATTCNA